MALSGRGTDSINSTRKGQAKGNSAWGWHNRTCASNFRKCIDFKWVIELVDVNGNRRNGI